MTKMTGGEAIVKSLRREGVEVVFGLPGVQLYGILAGLRDEPGIRLITTRHEQATGYMADGYARAGGASGFGTALVVPGPGLLNAAGGLSTAYSVSSPVFMISGQVQRDFIGKDVGMLHEVNDQLTLIEPVTKWRKRALTVGEIPAAVQEAVYQLKTGRPRPVEIEVPPETMEEQGEAVLLDPKVAVREGADSSRIDAAAEMLINAKHPVIIAGGGVVLGDAVDELGELAEALQAGVFTTLDGKAAIPWSNPFCMGLGRILGGTGPAGEYFTASDVVIGVGSRLAGFGGSIIPPGKQVIHIDIDPEEVGRNYEDTYGLAGDAGKTMKALAERVRSAGSRPSATAEINAVRDSIFAGADGTQPQWDILRGLQAGAPDDTILIPDSTQVGYYSFAYWKVESDRSYLGSGYSGNLGFAFPTGLGAKVAQPDRPVVVIAGDGGFMYNVSEMATAVQHGINLVTVVFNDNAFGNVGRDLDIGFGGKYGTDLHNPDFPRLAKSYGMEGMQVKDPARIGDALQDAIQMDAPVLIEVPVDRMPVPHFFPQRPQAPQRPE
ncbi:MAG: thiamine pyrophosphate-binding protein [Dehalococcoidia bacterium]|jgi:acetolactate synthase-1/2/3 large subunit|nr:thiamine pyrophosphate-binding protein [Dehalococcoidia bacterium]